MVQIQPRPELPLYRLYVLRASYLLLSLGQGSKTWPAILHHAQTWDFWRGVGMSFFGALTLLCLLGVRYPVRMMPLLIFEFTWKLIWVLAAWLPPTSAIRWNLTSPIRSQVFSRALWSCLSCSRGDTSGRVT